MRQLATPALPSLIALPRLIALLALIALPLSACGGEGATVSIDASDGDNSSTGAAGKSGEMAIKLPGFSGNFKLPKTLLSQSKLDLNGVSLYPGATLTGMTVDVRDKSEVRFSFDAPAKPEVVRDWYAGRLAKAAYVLKTEGNVLIGTDEDKKPFRMELTAGENGTTKGTILATD